MADLPDDLVQAAAEALALEWGVLNRDAARVALQAAFAKLPEVEAAVRLVAEAIMRPDVRAHYETTPDPGAAVYYQERATDGLAALAREFGGRE